MVDYKTQVDIIIAQLAQGAVNFVLSPQRWDDCQLPVNLQWSPVLFDESTQATGLPNVGGVYGFLLKPAIAGPPETAYLLYIGQTNKISRRFNDYRVIKTSDLGYKRRPVIHDMLNKWPTQIWFLFARVDDPDIRETVETILLNSCVPPFNTDFKGTVNTAVRRWRNLGEFR